MMQGKKGQPKQPTSHMPGKKHLEKNLCGDRVKKGEWESLLTNAFDKKGRKRRGELCFSFTVQRESGATFVSEGVGQLRF